MNGHESPPWEPGETRGQERFREPDVPRSPEGSDAVAETARPFPEQVRHAAYRLAESVKEYLSDDEAHVAFASLLLELTDAASSLESSENPATTQESLLRIESARAGMEELRSSLAVPEDTRAAFNALVLRLETALNAAPLPLMAATPEESAAAVRRFIAAQAANPYQKTLSRAGEAARTAADRTVRAALEKMAGIIPAEKLKAVTDAAAHLAGSTAFGIAAIGTGVLLTGASQVAAEGVHIHQEIDDQGGSTIEIGRENGETLRIIPSRALDAIVTSGPESEFFQRVRMLDHTESGVNYVLEDSEAFREAVMSDAHTFSEERLGVPLRDLTPTQFIFLVNKIVAERLEYDSAATMKDGDGNLSEAAKVENEKISSMPLDAMYLSYGKGVCRHYAALVEMVGELLIEKGAVPHCAGIAIDELGSDALNHAWNVFYLNDSSRENSVAVSYTDATWNDSGTSLNARDTRHDSVRNHLPLLSLTPDELRSACEKLVGLEELGGAEARGMHLYLAENAAQRYAELKNASSVAPHTGTEILEMRAALETMRDHALRADLLSTDRTGVYSAEFYMTAVSQLIQLHHHSGNGTEAQKLLTEAQTLTEQMECINRDLYQFRLKNLAQELAQTPS